MSRISTDLPRGPNNLGKSARRFDWIQMERIHARDAVDIDYGDECIIPLANGREIRCSAYPQPCTYVRIVQAGYELMYWDADEWGDTPEEVMGAVLGLAHGR